MYTKKLQQAHSKYLSVIKQIAKAHAERIATGQGSDTSDLITDMHKQCEIIRGETGKYPAYDNDINHEMDVYFSNNEF